ncbi:sialidase family protein [Glycomyces xiaoerkulensis]|uniref:sialidase family protein n=1 Tax=Glycomyces xiaoerkulensis TaxID=2038139 RepID=UPI000C26AAAF|nr:sialidase family protein [Glycomyces xiaoerkulensis]
MNRTRPARLALALLTALGLLIGTGAALTAPAAAAGPGEVLYSPGASGTAGYPRAIRLDHDGSPDPTMLATFARSGHGQPGDLPVYRSTDGGQSWAHLSTVTSNTPGWDLEAPTLFEVPRSIPGLNQGDLLASGTAWDVGDYTAQKVEVFKSTDGGLTWQYLSNCTETSGMPDTWGHGIWEPVFRVGDDDSLACFISDERPENSPTNNQIIGHYTSADGGQTWNSQITHDVAFPGDPYARPGMQTFADLPDGSVVMAYERCRDATDPDHACEVWVKKSPDGIDWSPADDPGTLVTTADDRELLHTPYVSWVPGGGPNGTVLISGQRVVSGPTGDKTVLSESGTVLFANTNLGDGPWTEHAAPVTVDPTGGYNSGEPSCPGYSTPAIPREGGGYLYLAATWLGDGNRCEVRFGIGQAPGPTGQVPGPGGKCLDVDTNTADRGNAVQLWTCGDATGQRWELAPDGTVRAFGKCLDIDGNGTANFTPVILWDCNGVGGQQWEVQSDGSLRNPQSGRCLDAPEGRTDDGTQLQIYDCNGLWTQQWTWPS